MKILAPDIGSLFTYKGSKYRVTAYQRRVRPEEIPASDDEILDSGLSADEMLPYLLNRILYEARSDDLVWCHRSEATHVSGTGIAGCIAPVEEITVDGHVSEHWPESLVKSERRHAAWLVEQRDF
jgi:hypothetical protein